MANADEPVTNLPLDCVTQYVILRGMSIVLTDQQLRNNLAVNLTRLLEAKDWSQSDLARAIQEDGENVQAARMRAHRYMHGLHSPEPARLANLAEILGVTVDSIIAAPARKKTRNAG